MLGYLPDTLFVVVFIVACHWSQVFVNFANLPPTSIPCYLCHPHRRRLPPLCVVYASALSSMSLLVDSRLSHLKSSIFGLFVTWIGILSAHSSCRIQGIIIFGQRLCPLSLYPRQFNLFLRLLPPPHPLRPPSPATRVCIVFAAFAPKRGSGSSLVRYQYPSLIVFAYGARGPLQYTHVYRRRLCPVIAVPLPCRRLLSLAVYARDKVSLLWNLLRLYLVLASSSSLSLLVLCHHGLEDPSKTSSQALRRFPCLCRCFVTMGLETPTKLHPSLPSQPVTSYRRSPLSSTVNIRLLPSLPPIASCRLCLRHSPPLLHRLANSAPSLLHRIVQSVSVRGCCPAPGVAFKLHRSSLESIEK